MTEPIRVTPYQLASRYLTIREFPGGEDHPLIQWWLMNAGMGRHQRDETPWCGAFINNIAWELWLSRPAFPARARSWLTVGAPIRIEEAEVGFDFVILSRSTGVPPGPEVIDAPGHVGMFSKHQNDQVWLLAGNQSDRVNISPFPVSRILGVRRFA